MFTMVSEADAVRREINTLRGEIELKEEVLRQYRDSFAMEMADGLGAAILRELSSPPSPDRRTGKAIDRARRRKIKEENRLLKKKKWGKQY